LIDVMGNMSFLLIEPMLEKHFYTVGIFKRIGPGRFRETYEKFISHFPEAAHNFKCFARALKYACSTDRRLRGQLPSTKGLL